MEDREESVQHFLDLIKRSRRGKFKIYIGMIAGHEDFVIIKWVDQRGEADSGIWGWTCAVCNCYWRGCQQKR